MLLGVLAGLATCALWGLTFIAPRAVEPFTVWDLTIARYLVFGAASGLLLASPRFRPQGLSFAQKAIGLCLGGVGYIGYFLSASFAVKSAGATLPPLIIGTMPVILALIGNAGERSIAWTHLALPLALIALGIVVVNAHSVFHAASEDCTTSGAGLAWALLSLAIWVAYGLVNSRILRGPAAPDILAWTGLQGLGAGLGALAIMPMSSLFAPQLISGAEPAPLLVWALVMGLAGSWLATWFWAIASTRLPLTFAAQLIVAETIFGLLYGFVWESRFPTILEAAGIALQVAGVSLTLARLGRASKRQARCAT
jgi:drug/metabolite transporter (DMT)-like permease